ncbi:MAG: hypothetical protein K0S71_2722 [Clostridia bacterium]|jgi:hypothetical protein|nr:hypothetical protein [Clostridia bacterium]
MEVKAYDIMLAPIILGGVEILKNIGLPLRFCPVAALVLGVILGTVYLAEGDIKQGVLKGIYLGFTSVGMYSGTKNIMKK